MTWAIWLTGPPASGKSTLARSFVEVAGTEGVRVARLESDALRRILTPNPTYEPHERDRFYRQLADLAALLVSQGIPVVVDATASRRAYREYARSKIPCFFEVLVDAPRDLREARDPKGLYRLAAAGAAPHLPGGTEAYEAPASPDLTVAGTGEPETALAPLLRLARSHALL